MKPWLPIALAVLGWHSLLAALAGAAREEPGLRGPALVIAFALPAAGLALLLRSPDVATPAGRRRRLWAHLATVAPVVATALRLPQGLPTRPAWLALFGAPLAVGLWRSLRGEPVPLPPAAAPIPRNVLALHRAGAVAVTAFAVLHVASHLSAAHSLALNTRVVDAVRLVYKQPVVEATLLLAILVQSVTGLWLYATARDSAADRWDRLQLASGLYLAVFLAAHTTATAVLFRDLNFRSASGGALGLLGDPSFLAYYVLGPLAVFAHVACAARALMRRSLGLPRAERLATSLLGAGAALTLVIALALSGVHVRDDRDRPQPRPAKVR